MQGVNAILHSLARTAPAAPRGKLLLLLTAYYMVKATASYLFPGSQTVTVNVPLPLSPDALLAAVRKELEAAPGQFYAASFSHIVSLPGVILPVKKLAALCHAHGVLALIDGAHALGHIPVNVVDIGADFWLGNMHKWGYGAKGSAVLWVSPAAQAMIKSTTISWEGRGATHFLLAFSYVGTTSYSNYLAMGAALDFRERVGGEAAAMTYIHRLAVDGGALLARAWHTDVLHADTLYGAMVDVRIPTTNATLAINMDNVLMTRYNTWVPIYDIGSVGGSHGVFHARVSAQIFNDLSDFQHLADAVLELIREGEGWALN
jgi:selenocysteine lyase/cysteine desulfurase